MRWEADADTHDWWAQGLRIFCAVSFALNIYFSPLHKYITYYSIPPPSPRSPFLHAYSYLLHSKVHISVDHCSVEWMSSWSTALYIIQDMVLSLKFTLRHKIYGHATLTLFWLRSLKFSNADFIALPTPRIPYTLSIHTFQTCLGIQFYMCVWYMFIQFTKFSMDRFIKDKISNIQEKDFDCDEVSSILI